MFKIRNVSKKIVILFLIVITIIPFSVFAENYNTSLEEDRKKVQEILPDATFDSENKPSVGVVTFITKGNTIYFENTNNWTDISIYIFNDSNDELTGWPGVAMEKVDEKIDDKELYKYVFDGDDEIYNRLIFTGNDPDSGRKQTKDLAYIGDKLYFCVNDQVSDGSKYDGSWFLYDKSVINNYIQLMSDLSEYKSYITADSYANIDEVINSAKDVIAMQRIKANFYEGSTNNLYINEYYETLYKITNGVSNLKIDTEILEKAILDAESKNIAGWSDDAKEELSNAVTSSREILENLKDNPNIFDVSPNTSIDDVNSQFKKNIDTIRNIKMSVDELESIINSSDSGIINDLTNNPETNSVIFTIIMLVLILITVLFMYIFYNKRYKVKK